ncbi:hypothetical protein NDA13_004721 [Ustilago tritici]|nr:hypothetical protein NDA13_004721 [Ustilago tritici]
MFRSILSPLRTITSFSSSTTTTTTAAIFNTHTILTHTPLRNLSTKPWFSDIFDISKVPRYKPSTLSPTMQSYTKHFPSESEPLVSLSFNGESHIFILTMLGNETPDNRLTHKFIGEALLPAIAHVEHQWNEMLSSGQSDQGAALVTTAGTSDSAKIFSNGLDLEKAIADPLFFDTHLNELCEKLLTLPIPAIAAVNGHAFAAGFGLACAHDYRIMNAKRGYMCMNEIDFGAPLPHGLQMTIASKISDQKTMRKVVLEGHRFSAEEAFQAGFVDGLADSPKETLEKALQLAEKLKGKAKMNAWGTNKEVIYANAVKAVRMKHDEATRLLYAPRAKM